MVVTVISHLCYLETYLLPVKANFESFPHIYVTALKRLERDVFSAFLSLSDEQVVMGNKLLVYIR